MSRQYSQESQNNKSSLSQDEAQKLDAELMGPEYGYTLEQLMELAGLSCAQAILECYPPHTLPRGGLVLICCGPGNNGGDGLVCARHLRLFGYKPSVYYPKQPHGANVYHPANALITSNNPSQQHIPLEGNFFDHLRTQIAKFDIPFLSYFPKDSALIDNAFDLIVDAIFGFGFKSRPKALSSISDENSLASEHIDKSKNPSNENYLPEIRAPFDEVLCKMHHLRIPIVSIDVPSGWDVDGKHEPQSALGKYYINPDALVSLTAPKECARHFKGRYHYLGGRFLPPSLQNKYDLKLPAFPGASQCVNFTTPKIVNNEKILQSGSHTHHHKHSTTHQ